MTERNADGKFGTTPKKKRRGRGFQKGDPKPPTSGRKKGTPNKISRAVKEFLIELVDDSEVQAGVRERIIRGDAVAFFRALEQVIGKPVERFQGEVEHKVRVYRWQS